MHRDISQEQFHAENYGKNATKPMAYPDLTPALTPRVRALSVDALFGELNEGLASHRYLIDLG